VSDDAGVQGCTSGRVGVSSTLPVLVVCGGYTALTTQASNGQQGEQVSDALRLDLATMRWEPMPALVTARSYHACCAVRGAPVVLGGITPREGRLASSVEMLSSSEEGGAFVDLPSLSRGEIYGAAAVAVEESDSAAGQVLLLGGRDGSGSSPFTVHLVDLAAVVVPLVDLATGACAPQDNLLHPRFCPAAGRLPDGRVVCAGGITLGGNQSAEVWGPPEQGAPGAAWTWRELPRMGTERIACCGCVMSDGRFAVLGGGSNTYVSMSSCEALVVDDGAPHWVPLPPMHDARSRFECGAVARCVIVAGGGDHKSAELYDAELNRWLRLPCDLPYVGGLSGMGSAVL
jgi:hypothetical protein